MHGDQRPQLRRLLDLDGAGRAALHEQLRQPDRRRRIAGRPTASPWPKPATSPATHHAAAVGRLGRRAGRPGHHRRQPAGRHRHLQCRRLRGRPRSLSPTTSAWASPPATSTGTQWVWRLRRPGPHRHLPGRPLWQLHPGQGLRRRRAGLRLHLQPDVAEHRHPRPAAAHRHGQTGANQWYGQIETGYRFDLGTNANAFITPFARLQAYTGTQNAFTETGAQSLNLIGGAADHQLAALGDRRAARRLDGSRLAREACAAAPAGLEPRVCRHRRGR